MTSLPKPSDQALTHSQQLASYIQNQIAQSNGWLPFANFMQLALYTPHLGYYSGDAKKFGIGGDFVTAPELTPLFGNAVSRQIAELLAHTGGDILELGAGSGRLALHVLQALEQKRQLPQHYYILEVSAHLREQQQTTLLAGLAPDVFARVQWLDSLPKQIIGVVLANEVLDAIAVHSVHRKNKEWFERGISFNFTQGMHWQSRPLQALDLLKDIPAELLDAWPDDYVTEICPAANGLIASLAELIKQGAILIFDYGFSADEYYHPQRRQGTLMCHYQHYSHDNPLINIGLQDITAHVNFSAIANTGLEHDLDCLGYTNQAQFLINVGITELLQQMLQQTSASDVAYLRTVSALQKLVSPAEMGELFKVMALGKGIAMPLSGFMQGDKRHAL